MSFLTQDQINQLTSLSTTQILEHFGSPVTIQVVRSEKTNTPCIVFHSSSGILCNVLAKKHANVLTQMQSGWNPMVMNASKDKAGEYFSVVPLKGLKPSTLRAWVSKARSAGFIVDDQVSVIPQVKVEIQPTHVEVEVVSAEEVISAKAVEALAPLEELATQYGEPTTAPKSHKPFGLPGKVATVKDLKKVLRAQGKSTAGNKAALLARL